MIRLAFAAALAALPLPLLAQPQDAAARSASEAAPDEADENIVVRGKKICERRVETGSIMPRRVCRTPEQIAAEQERAQRTLDRLRRDQNAAQFTRESQQAGGS